MGLFKRLHALLNLSNAKRSEARFGEAYARFQDAKRRKDTRDQHAAWGALRDAQTARLNRALGWRGTR